MMPSQKPTSPHVRNIALDIVLNIVTCSAFSIYVNYKQMRAVNAMLDEQKYHFVHWALLTLITCGLYHIYHEYRKSEDIDRAMGRVGSYEPILAAVLTIFLAWWVSDAIQQVQINRYYGSDSV